MRRRMGTAVLLVAVVALVAAVMAGCGSSTPSTTPTTPTTTPKTTPSTTPSSKSKVPVYTETNKNITAKVGTEFIIELQANATTGYQWQITGPLSPAVQKVSQTYVPSATSSSTVGSGGVEKFTFKAVSAGDALIQLEYMPPGGGQSSQTVVFNVTVS